MLNDVPVFKFCCFTNSILDLICISALIAYLSLFLCVFFGGGGKTSGLKSKMLQQTRHNAASTHYMKSTGNKNCLAKLHLSRNDNESLKTNTRKKENYHRHHAASEEK